MKLVYECVIGSFIFGAAFAQEPPPGVTIGGEPAYSEKFEPTPGYTLVYENSQTSEKDGMAVTLHIYIEVETRARHQGKGAHTFHYHVITPMSFRSDLLVTYTCAPDLRSSTETVLGATMSGPMVKGGSASMSSPHAPEAVKANDPIYAFVCQ